MAGEGSSSQSRFCIVPQSALAMYRQRPADEAVNAQSKMDDSVMQALSEFVDAARGGRLESRAALQLQALAW